MSYVYKLISSIQSFIYLIIVVITHAYKTITYRNRHVFSDLLNIDNELVFLRYDGIEVFPVLEELILPINVHLWSRFCSIYVSYGKQLIRIRAIDLVRVGDQ